MTNGAHASAEDESPDRAGKNDELLGVVLAGGLSARLGHDKALVRLGAGEAPDLLARTVSLLRPLCRKVIIAGRRQPGYECLPDILPGNGPLGGIASALAHAEGAACLVLSCDLPFMETSILETLIARRRERPRDALVTAFRQQETGHTEALVAIYETAALPYLDKSLAGKRLKISAAVPVALQHHIPYAARDSLPFFNINYPADLEIARRVMSSLGR